MTSQIQVTAAEKQRIALTINSWKSKLLDISKRNRALNFKPNKVSTVAVVDEQAAETFRLLCVQNKSLKFKAKPEAQTRERLGIASANPVEDELSDFGEEAYEPDSPSMDFVPYDSTAAAAGNYTDDVLQTNSAPDHLDKSLRRLEEQARSSIEEQGVNALFLALGMLQYS